MGNYSLIYARLAQTVERGTFNPAVKGSSPLSATFIFFNSFYNIHHYVNIDFRGEYQNN
jgi:hypothetical protein